MADQRISQLTDGGSLTNSDVVPIAREVSFGVYENYKITLTNQNVSTFNNDAGYLTASDVSEVAISGSYTDLVNTPSIVNTFNGDSGDITLSAGTGITITGSGGAYTVNATGGGGSGVSSLNTLTGNLTIAAGANVTITDNGTDTITIAASGGGGGGSVESVNGVLPDMSGDVSLTTDDIPEGTTNFYYSETLFDASLAGKTTDDLTPGVTNLYFTNALAQAAVSGLYVGLTGNESIAGIKTFTSFPVSPSSSPTTDYQFANKKYVDDQVSLGIDNTGSVINVNVNTPPGSPSVGDRYVVGTSPTGAWASNAKNIATWNGSSWTFVAPALGLAVYNLADGFVWRYNLSNDWEQYFEASITTGQNGLTDTGSVVELGGTLIKNTTITQGNFGLTFNLSGTGDFIIQDAGTNVFQVDDTGFTRIGSAATNLGQLAITPITTATRGLVIAPLTGQTANLFETRNPGGATTQMSVTSDSRFLITNTGVDRTTPVFSVSQTPTSISVQTSTASSFTITTRFIAFPFTPGSNFNAQTVLVWLRKTATITNEVTAVLRIRSDSAGTPGSIISGTTQNVNVNDFLTSTTTFGERRWNVAASGVSLVSGTQYWISLDLSALPTGGNIEVQGLGSGSFWTSTNGTSWTSVGGFSPRCSIHARVGRSLEIDTSFGNAGVFIRNDVGISALEVRNKNGIAILVQSDGTCLNMASSYGNCVTGTVANGFLISGTITGNGRVVSGNLGTGTGTGVFVTGTGAATGFDISLGDGLGGRISLNPASTNVAHEFWRFTRLTTGTAAAGLGAASTVYLEASASPSGIQASSMDTTWTDATTATSTARYEIRLRNNNSLPASGSGQFQFDGNGDFRATRQIVLPVATGTAPLSVTSTTLNTNLNADLLDSQQGSWYQDRANHTGTQLASTISDFDTEVSNNADVAANTADRHVAATIGTANGLSILGQAISLATASGSTTGALTSTDWTTFNSKQNGDATLTALAAYNTNGILTQTAADTFTGRTITGTADQITVTNGNGVAGNPTLSLPTNVNIAGYFYANSGSDVATTSFSVLQFGVDSIGPVFDGSPLGLYWSDADVGNSRLEFRTDLGTYYNIAAGFITSNSGISSSGGVTGSTLTATTTVSAGSGTNQGVLDFNSTTANRIQFGTAGTAVPGASSVGMKIKLSGADGVMATSDYAIGIESGYQWFNTVTGYKWYDDTVIRAQLDTDGLDIYGSNTRGLRLRGTTSNAEIGDLYVGSSGELIISTVSGSDTGGYLDLRPEDDQFGVLIRESDGTGTATYANFYVTDAADDHLHICVNAAQNAVNALYVTDSDRVGVGVSAPLTKLHVVQTGGTVGSTLEVSSSATAVGVPVARVLATSTGDMANAFGPQLGFCIRDTANVVNEVARISAYRENASDTTGSIHFEVARAGVFTTYLRVDSLGNWALQTNSTLGREAITIIQNDADEPFINYSGTFDNVGDDPSAGNLTTIRAGSSSADTATVWTTGPRWDDSAGRGWRHVGMVRVAVNGTDYWMPYYEFASL